MGQNVGQNAVKLTVRRTRELTAPGRYGDGHVLYLYIRPGGTKQWVLRTTVHRKRTDIGLGSITYVSLAEAREKALELRRQAKSGLDPLYERRKNAAIPTFREASRTVWEQHKPISDSGSRRLRTMRIR